MTSPSSMKGKWRQKKLVVSEPITPKVRTYLQMLKLAEIVFQKHYSFLGKHKEDLISVALNKASRMLEQGDFDPKRGNIRNYLYAGMRNEIQNYYVKYIKYTRKDIPTEDFTLFLANKPLHDTCYDLDFHRVYEPIQKFEKRYGDLRLWVLSYIDEIGWFLVNNSPDEELSLVAPPKQLDSKLKTLVMWSIFDSIID